MTRNNFIKKLSTLTLVSLFTPAVVVEAQFTNAAILIVLQKIWDQAFSSATKLKELWTQAEDLITNVEPAVDFLEMRGWFDKIAGYHKELAKVAYYTKQLIAVYHLGKEFEGQIGNIDAARIHYLNGYKIAIKALNPRTKGSLKERIELLKQADNEIKEGRTVIKAVEALIKARIHTIDLLQKKRKSDQSK
jgi:hypothetical protein